jgi:hypothetical protein
VYRLEATRIVCADMTTIDTAYALRLHRTQDFQSDYGIRIDGRAQGKRSRERERKAMTRY